MGIAKQLLGNVFNGGFHVELSRETVRRVVDTAWIDNCPDKLYFATGPARRVFNEAVSEYIRAYFKSTGRLPQGDHDILGDGRRMIYFAPVKESLGRQPLVATA